MDCANADVLPSPGVATPKNNFMCGFVPFLIVLVLFVLKRLNLKFKHFQVPLRY